MRFAGSNVVSRLLCASSLLLGAGTARAEPVELEALEAQAIRSRASMAAARARVDGAEARIALAKVPYYPTLAAKGQVLATPGGRVVTVLDDNTKTQYRVSGAKALGDPGAFVPNVHYDATLALSSRLYDFGRTAASVRAARAERDASLSGVQGERLAIALEVREAYLGWLMASGTRAVLARGAADATTLRTSVEAHVAEGTRPGAELAAARYDEARAALDLERSDADLAGARLALEEAAGTRLSASAEPDPKLLDRAAPAASPGVHPDVRTLERRRDAAAASADAHSSPFAPIVAVGADAGLRGQATTPFPVYDVGLSVTVPLLDGGLEAASAAAATSQATELSALAREARRKLAARSERARQNLASAERRLALAAKLVAAAEQTVKHAKDQHDLGAGGFDAVIAAQLQAARATLEVLAARVERARAVLELSAP